MTETINQMGNKIISSRKTNSNTPEPNSKRRHTGEANRHMLNNIEKVKNDLALAKSKVKVLLLAYGRTGSSLTGDLISADTTSAYFFEPFW